MKKIKVGIAGLGRIAHMGHFKELLALPDKFEITAVCDNAPERLDNLPESLKNVSKYTSLDQMLKDDNVDMVNICTRHREHVPMALEILASGRIAVVEKPVAVSVKEFDLLVSAAKNDPQKLFLRHNRRFEPGFTKAKQLVDSGVIGAIQYIKLNRSVGFCRRNDWMTMSEFYGGLLSNWGPHIIDQALQFLNSPVTDIWADVRNVISIGDGDDLFKILLRSKSGRVAEIEVTGANTLPGREIEMIGSRGTLIHNGKDVIEVKRIDPAVELKKLAPHPENPPLKYGNFDEKLYFVEERYQVPEISDTVLWEHLWNTVVNNVPFPVTFSQAREVVRITEEAFKISGFAPMQKFLS